MNEKYLLQQLRFLQSNCYSSYFYLDKIIFYLEFFQLYYHDNEKISNFINNCQFTISNNTFHLIEIDTFKREFNDIIDYIYVHVNKEMDVV